MLRFVNQLLARDSLGVIVKGVSMLMLQIFTVLSINQTSYIIIINDDDQIRKKIKQYEPLDNLSVTAWRENPSTPSLSF